MAIMDTPKVLNGYPVIRVEQHGECSTVMMAGADKFIVATWFPNNGSGWSWGHYHHFNSDETRNDALDDATVSFNQAATRNARR